jgi:hypothetical protein
LILTDGNYVPVGEILNATNRSISVYFNKIDLLSFQVRLDNPLSEVLATTLCFVKAYRDNDLEFFGPVISAGESGDATGATLAVNCASAGWILSKRLAGKSATGDLFDTATDRAMIVASLITTANAQHETGIDSVTGPLSSASSITYTAGPYRFISDILSELSASTAGFDWRVRPVENFINGVVASPKIARFEAKPTWGQDRPNAVFEWGSNGRGNIASYTRSVDRSTQANNVFHFTSNGPDAPGYPTMNANDPANITVWNQLEDLAQADILDPTLRQTLLNEHIAVRENPRQIITFNPHIDPTGGARLPRFGLDYEVGDRVRARAQFGNSVRFDALFRVWGVTFTVDNNGTETASLQLVDE